MLPDIHRATQKFYIFLIVYLTGCTPIYLPEFVCLVCLGKSEIVCYNIFEVEKLAK